MRSKSEQIAYNNGWNKGRNPDYPACQTQRPSYPTLAKAFDEGFREGAAYRLAHD